MLQVCLGWARRCRGAALVMHVLLRTLAHPRIHLRLPPNRELLRLRALRGRIKLRLRALFSRHVEAKDLRNVNRPHRISAAEDDGTTRSMGHESCAGWSRAECANAAARGRHGLAHASAFAGRSWGGAERPSGAVRRPRSQCAGARMAAAHPWSSGNEPNAAAPHNRVHELPAYSWD